MLEIQTQQVFSRRGLSYLREKIAQLDPKQESFIRSLAFNKKKALGELSITSTYKLADSRIGKLGFGRLYGSKGSLEKLEKECRGTLCQDFYHDIDVVNCHPVLLVQFASRYWDKDLVEVEQYCDDRNKYLHLISENRDEAKEAIIKILYNGKNKYPFLENFQEEVKTFTKFLSKQEKYKELFEACKANDNIYGSFLSAILQTEERAVMLCMKEAFETLGWSVDVLAYDGVMIRKSSKLSLCDEMIRTVEKKILETTGYTIQLVEKEFVAYDIPVDEDQLIPGLTKDEYFEHKKVFEENHFYYKPTNEYGEIHPNGTVSFYPVEHAREICSVEFIHKNSEKFGDYICLFDLWKKDTTRRVIHKIDYKPSEDPTTLVLPLLYQYKTSAAPSNSEEIVQTFLSLIKVNTNNQEADFQYVLKYIAHLLQKPFECPRTALMFTGDQGAGKDLLWEFLGSKVLGSQYYQDYDNNGQFFGPHDTGRSRKLLVKLQEADPQFCRKNASQLKAVITSPVSTFNPKGKSAFETPNYNRLILTTNKGNPLELDQSDRRWVMFSNSNELCGDYSRIKAIVEQLFYTQGAGAAVAEYLLSLDLGSFSPEKDKPLTELKKIALHSERSAIDCFLDDWDGEVVTGSQFFDLFTEFCTANRLRGYKSMSSLGKDLVKYETSGKIKVGRKTKGNTYWKEAPLSGGGGM